MHPPFLAIAASLVALHQPGASTPIAPPNSPEQLAFLQGHWTSADGTTHATEFWAPPTPDAMAGMFHMTQDAKIVLYEVFTVEPDAQGLALRLRHFGAGLTPWESERDGPSEFRAIEIGASRAVFENPEHDFPRRLVYSVENDALRVELSGEGEEPMVFEFRRAE